MNASKITGSAGFRMAVIALLALLLMIPAAMVRSLIEERERTRDRAVAEIGEKWGGCQTVGGPVLTIPYRHVEKDRKGRVVSSTVERLHILPDRLDVSGTVDPQVRYRGIYEAVLYNARLSLSGTFPKPDPAALGIPAGSLLWSEAYLSVGVPDMKGIRDSVRVRWNGASVEAGPGIASEDVFESGVSAPVRLCEGSGAVPFSLELNLNGSRELSFLPVGRETKVALSSRWSAPGFRGEFLPERRTVTKDGFTAEWKVLSMNRNYPQQWVGKTDRIASSAFGVGLLLPLDEYRKTLRTAKYSAMFVALTFAAFFVIEILGKKALHPIQYLLVGLALVLFYTLLLSLSEHIRFGYGYLVSAAGIVGMVSAYSLSALSSRRYGAVVAGVVAGLYGYLYVLLQREDYALLLGSVGLFAILGMFMYLTRKVDWFRALRPAVEP